MTNSPGMRVHDLAYRHPGAAVGIRVPEFELVPGKPTALVGPSGSGKTTLLRLLTGLLPPTSGTVSASDLELHRSQPSTLRDWRLRHVGLIFQDFALLPYLTARENAELPSRFLTQSNSATSERAHHLADQLSLTEHWTKPASILSQGERQRVAIVRALAHQPDFVFADEPTASLDQERRNTALDLLLADAVDRNICLLVITHDLERLDGFSHVLRMEDFQS